MKEKTIKGKKELAWAFYQVLGTFYGIHGPARIMNWLYDVAHGKSREISELFPIRPEERAKYEWHGNDAAQPAPLKMRIQCLVGLPLDQECPDEIVLDAIKAQRHAIRVFQEAADRAQPAPGWISVSDAMPKYSEDGPEFVLVCWKEGWRGRKLSGNKDDNSVASPSGFDSCFIPYFLARHFHQATHWQYVELPAAPPEPAQEPKK